MKKEKLEEEAYIRVRLQITKYRSVNAGSNQALDAHKVIGGLEDSGMNPRASHH